MAAAAFLPDVATAEVQEALIDRLRRQVPGVAVTKTLIAINLAVFLAMLGAGAGLWHSPNGVQLAWGANFGPATQDGEWWRLGSALFLHFGLLHLAMNLWAMWDAGQLAERFYGHTRFIAIYFGAGLIGNLASLVVQGNKAVSGGASGAIFGVFGALMVALWFERRDIHRTEFRWLFWGATGFASATLVLGLLITGMDNSAHFGGWISGMLLGTLFNRHSVPRQKLLIGAALAMAVATLITLIPPPKYQWHEETEARQSINAFLQDEVRIGANWQSILNEGRRRNLSFEQLADRIENDVTERYEENFERLSRAPIAPELPSAQALRKLQDYAALRRDASRTLTEGLRSHDQAKIRRGLAQAERAKQNVQQPAASASKKAP